ncbi:MAG: hypothetical protein JWQ98_2236 [Chlorobi bacterium]|nr:hypothetical protein [Chlorobiota bacterium]
MRPVVCGNADFGNRIEVPIGIPRRPGVVPSGGDPHSTASWFVRLTNGEHSNIIRAVGGRSFGWAQSPLRGALPPGIPLHDIGTTKISIGESGRVDREVYIPLFLGEISIIFSAHRNVLPLTRCSLIFRYRWFPHAMHNHAPDEPRREQEIRITSNHEAIQMFSGRTRHRVACNRDPRAAGARYPRGKRRLSGPDAGGTDRGRLRTGTAFYGAIDCAERDVRGAQRLEQRSAAIEHGGGVRAAADRRCGRSFGISERTADPRAAADENIRCGGDK